MQTEMPLIRREEDKPKNKLKQWGATGLGDAELLAVLLGTDSVDAGKEVIKAGAERGGLGRLALADLCAVYGVKESKAAVVLAALELGRREAVRANNVKAWRFSGSRQSFEFFREQLGNMPQEAFCVVGLDSKNKLVGSRIVSLGTINQSLVHPREVFQPVLAMRAAGMMIAHNHPSGDPTASPEDHEVTRRLKGCADLLAITLVDHVIVGRDRYFSYSDANWPK